MSANKSVVFFPAHWPASYPAVRMSARRFSAAALDFFARLESAPEGNLRVNAFDKAHAALIDRLVGNGGNFWPESGAFCPMAGYLFPGTDTGAGQRLVPLRDSHDAGQLIAFVTGDWNAVTGLKGVIANSTYVNTHRNTNADPQNDHAMGCYLTEGTPAVNGDYAIIGAGGGANGATQITPNYNTGVGGETIASRSRAATANTTARAVTPRTGYIAISRALEASYIVRVDGASTTTTRTSQTPYNGNACVFARESVGTPGLFNSMRSPFYHIGANLSGTGELAEMDAGLTKWVTDIAAA